MNCKGNFVFKELNYVKAGVFKNDKGEEISYKDSYKLKVDEVTNNGINERIFKIDPSNTNLVNTLKSFRAYQNISIEFDLEIFANGCRLKPLNSTLIK